MKRTLSTLYKLTLLAIIGYALCKEILTDNGLQLGAFLYFTIQSNIIVFFSLIMLIFFNENYRIVSHLRGISLMCITVTGFVYNFILYKIFLDWGTVGYTVPRTITHVVAPLGFIADWLIFGEHGKMKYKDVLLWILYPILYGIISLYISSKTSISLYFFLDSWTGINKLYPWLALIVLAFVIISLVFIKIDKKSYLRSKNRKCHKNK